VRFTFNVVFFYDYYSKEVDRKCAPGASTPGQILQLSVQISRSEREEKRTMESFQSAQIENGDALIGKWPQNCLPPKRINGQKTTKIQRPTGPLVFGRPFSGQ